MTHRWFQKINVSQLLKIFSEDGGYINASYINHYDTHFNQVENKKYISTQGPLPNTIEHFWQMVANEVSLVI